MLEIMEFYVSGFWVWAGLTFGLLIIAIAVVNIISSSFQR